MRAAREVFPKAATARGAPTTHMHAARTGHPPACFTILTTVLSAPRKIAQTCARQGDEELSVLWKLALERTNSSIKWRGCAIGARCVSDAAPSDSTNR